jgi:hypothetical protein
MQPVGEFEGEEIVPPNPAVSVNSVHATAKSIHCYLIVVVLKYGVLLNAAKIKIIDMQYVRTTLKVKG